MSRLYRHPHSRSILLRSILPLVGLFTFFVTAPAALAQRAGGETAEVEVTDAEDELTVPDGTPAELIAFIEQLAQPQREFASSEEFQNYQKRALLAIEQAADKILAGKPNDSEVVDAMQWKIASLNGQAQLGNADAEKKIDDFITSMSEDSRPSVAGAIAQLRLFRKLQRWNQLPRSEREAALDDFVATVKKTGLTINHVQTLLQLDQALSDTDDSPLAGKTFSELLPLFAKSDDPKVREMAKSAEAIQRRLNLPGNKIELEGNLLDGKPLDWDSYRGKVVLVDYWATWCGPCRAEVPNIIENYQAYRDKGFEVLGVSLDEDRAQAEQYMKEAGMTWPTLFSDDPNNTGWEHPMSTRYAITGIPRAILVNQDGVVVSMTARGPRLQAELEKLLGPPSADATVTDESAAK